MKPLEKRLLPWILAVIVAAGAYLISQQVLVAQPGGASPVQELENFRSSEQIGVDVSVPFPTDI